MSEAEISAPQRRGWRRLAIKLGLTVMRASLVISPRPMALLLRREFDKSGAARAERLRPGVAQAVQVARDEVYGPGEDCRLDVYVPTDRGEDGRPLPIVMWVHGGAFVGGTKDELDYYFRALSATGFCVVAIRYSLAPESTYPAPVEQALQALAHIQGNAARWDADPARIALAGDSAGSHIAAQVTAAITNQPYATTVGVGTDVPPQHVRAVVLCCGIYDFVAAATDPTMATFMKACGWAYSGVKDFLDDQRFITSTAVGDNITADFPPAFLTVGNTDPLRTQTEGFIRALERAGVEVESLSYPSEHRPPLSHEYQFDLELVDARLALERIAAFLYRTLG